MPSHSRRQLQVLRSTLDNQNGIVGWWPFDNNSLTDNSGYGLNLTADTVAPNFSAGRIAGVGYVSTAANFAGTDHDLYALPSAASLALSTGTISAWIKTSAPGAGFRGIVVKANAYGLFLNDSVLVTFDWGAVATRSTGVNLADGKWHHVAMAFVSGSTNGTKIYIDGALSLTTTITVANQNVAFGVGYGGGVNLQNIVAKIDDPRVYKRALSGSEISAIYLDPYLPWMEANMPIMQAQAAAYVARKPLVVGQAGNRAASW